MTVFVVSHIAGAKRILVPPGSNWTDEGVDVRQSRDENLQVGDTVKVLENGSWEKVQSSHA